MLSDRGIRAWGKTSVTAHCSGGTVDTWLISGHRVLIPWPVERSPGVRTLGQTDFASLSDRYTEVLCSSPWSLAVRRNNTELGLGTHDVNRLTARVEPCGA